MSNSNKNTVAMKKILLPIFVLLLNGCDTINQDNSKIISKKPLHIQRKVPNHILDLLQGNWGKSNESNVDFTITNKEIKYFENPEDYSIALNGDTLTIIQDNEILTKYKIISISKQKLELKPEEGENIFLTKIL
jgi:uncharacterized protein YceK